VVKGEWTMIVTVGTGVRGGRRRCGGGLASGSRSAPRLVWAPNGSTDYPVLSIPDLLQGDGTVKKRRVQPATLVCSKCPRRGLQCCERHDLRRDTVQTEVA
jgi:hypothetical protein